MGFRDWLAELPFGTSQTNSQGESSTGPPALPLEAGNSTRSSERPDQQTVAFDPNATRIALPMESQPAFAIDAGRQLPQLQIPQPYVNPLAALMDRPDPALSTEDKRDAYAQMMERFQVGDPDVWHLTVSQSAGMLELTMWKSFQGPVAGENLLVH